MGDWNRGGDGHYERRSLSLQSETENTTIADITWYKDDEPLTVQRSSLKNMINIPEITGDDFGVLRMQSPECIGSDIHEDESDQW